MKQIYHILSLLAFLLLAFSCCNIGDEDEYTVTPPRTLLVYMVSSNLGGSMQTNIEHMKSVATRKNLNDGNLVVFYSTAKDGTASGRLFRIKEDRNGQVVEEEIRTYNEISAISPDFMHSVVEDVMRDFPAKSYGMILSSHGTSWMPTDYKDLRSFGEENGQRMEIYDLARALRGFQFDFLSFDACSMGGVECVYELKDVADYILASASEIISYGFPYKEVLPYYFTDEADLAAIAKGFYDFYTTYTYPYGNMAVIKTAALDDLAEVMAEIIAAAGEEALYGLSLQGVQVLSRFSSALTSLYDIEDLVARMVNEGLATEEQKTRFDAALAEVVQTKYCTEQVIIQGQSRLPVRTFSGLSIYPLRESLPQHNAWYLENLAWAKRVYPAQLDN
ncbi:hypothetical protein M2137_000138 [Parabacteroides sp. PFB2-10]|uniref:clostripain-related cysteine peptidase n=1 Tax=Parabacteroides sp. PFB2-10 TaxID=1742405 RepID=UPI0024760D53|nr:clostripain-related cysteine peptidase [Parabacteroides sp. PFB2-10]MDH6311388.1 hypothetical protein [Parabacteroides sp. PFB2-10]